VHREGNVEHFRNPLGSCFNCLFARLFLCRPTPSDQNVRPLRALTNTFMKHYHCETLILAPASAVYDAITTPPGLRGWWTATCEVGTGVGARSTFRFGQTHNVMEVESLRPHLEVRWRCLEQHHHAPNQLTRTDEWAGTSLIFRLIPESASSTLLKFEHLGLTPQLECYDICNRGWNHFLATNLKSYAETGKGTPYVEPTT
jgi:uncharacterized protein YndB with AHSA1/START domain